jgi:flagellar biosynthesis protein FliQ
MNQDVVITMMQNVFMLILELSTPILLVSVVIGLIVSIFQTITQIQESTLTFVPKIIAGVVTLIILMPWMINIFISQVNELFDSIPGLLKG